MRNVRRYDPQGAPVFVTIVCRNHRPLLLEAPCKETVLRVLKRLRSEATFKLFAWVILDDHLHLIVDLCMPDLSTAIGRLKQHIALGLRKSSLWQPRFFDHIVRDEADLRAHLDYIHFNPCRHGYVTAPVDYRWSSMRSMVRKGFYSEQWGALEVPATIVEGTGSE